MRCCMSRSTEGMPTASSLENIDKPAPRASARCAEMTGPSCFESPTRTTRLAPSLIGSKHSGSIACPASSITTLLKRRTDMKESPHAEQVQTTIAADRRAAREDSRRSDEYSLLSTSVSCPTSAWSVLYNCRSDLSSVYDSMLTPLGNDSDRSAIRELGV